MTPACPCHTTRPRPRPNNQDGSKQQCPIRPYAPHGLPRLAPSSAEQRLACYLCIYVCCTQNACTYREACHRGRYAAGPAAPFEPRLRPVPAALTTSCDAPPTLTFQAYPSWSLMYCYSSIHAPCLPPACHTPASPTPTMPRLRVGTPQRGGDIK
jgi:hypothetical protein